MSKPFTDLARIRPNWLVVLPICALVLSMAIVFAAILTIPKIGPSSPGRSLSGELSWPTIITADVAVAGAAMWVCWGILKQALTRFTSEGITQPRIGGSVHIAWSDILWVSPGVTVGSATEQIALSPHAFRNPEELMQIIAERVPEKTPVIERRSFGSSLAVLGRRRRN